MSRSRSSRISAPASRLRPPAGAAVENEACSGGRIELRKNSPAGALLASVDVKATGEGEFLDLPEFARFMAAETAKFAKVIRDAKITLE